MYASVPSLNFLRPQWGNGSLRNDQQLWREASVSRVPGKCVIWRWTALPSFVLTLHESDCKTIWDPLYPDVVYNARILLRLGQFRRDGRSRTLWRARYTCMYLTYDLIWTLSDSCSVVMHAVKSHSHSQPVLLHWQLLWLYTGHLVGSYEATGVQWLLTKRVSSHRVRLASQEREERPDPEVWL